MASEACGQRCPSSSPPETQLRRRHRIFQGRRQEPSELRRWLSSLLPEWPARDEVLCIASEVGSNAIQHTASGRPGGWFAVEINCGGSMAQLAITGGGSAGPRMIDDQDAEHGRGRQAFGHGIQPHPRSGRHLRGPDEPGWTDTPAAEEGAHVSALQALGPREPAAAREGENTAIPGLPAGGPPPGWQCCGLRVFDGRPDQVRAARQLVREHLAGHPAAGDAVLVVSELAANSVMHSASRFDAGRFLIRVTALDGRHAAVTVTDQGGPFTPQATAADGKSGRGLAIVRALTCLFRIHDHGGLRTFTAIISAPDTTPPDPPGAPSQPLAGKAPGNDALPRQNTRP